MKLREIVEACKLSVAVLGSLSRSVEREREAERNQPLGKQAGIRRIDVLELKALVQQVVRIQGQQAAAIGQTIADESIHHDEPVLSRRERWRKLQRRLELAALFDVRRARPDREAASREVTDLERQAFSLHMRVAEQLDRLAVIAAVLV